MDGGYMEIKLLRADISDAEELHAMQIKAFKELLEKYQGFDTSPGNECNHSWFRRLCQHAKSML